MKKTMIVLICIISCLVSSAYGAYENAQDKTYMMNIERMENSTSFYVKEDIVTIEEELAKFQELSEVYGASFIRTDTFFDDRGENIYKSGIFSSNYFKDLHLNLSHGTIAQSSDQFLATYDTGLPNQSGIIKDLFQDSPLIFGSLHTFYQENNITTVLGKYTLVVEESKKEAVLEELSSFFHTSKAELLEAMYQQSYAMSGLVIYAIILTVVILAIFSLMCVFYPISRLKEIGAMKLQGYKNIDIWKQLNKQVLMIPLIFYFLSIGVQQIIIKNSEISYFIKLSGLQAIFFSICLLFSFVMLIIIQKLRISAILKKFFNFRLSLYFSYTLKFLIFVSLIFTIPQMATGSKQLIKTLQIKNAYEEQKEYLTLANFIYVGNEFQESLNGNNTVRKKIYNLYKELEETAGCQYIETHYIEPWNSNLSYTEKWKDVTFEVDDYYTIMSANKNYLERIAFDWPVSLSEVFSENQLTVLAPESSESEKGKLEYLIHDQAKQYLYNYPEGESIYAEDVPVNIIYYPRNNKEIFSENFEMKDMNNGFVKNPIIFCMNDKVPDIMYYPIVVSAISNPIRILDTPENREKIQEAIVHNDLQLNALEFQNLLSTGFAREMFFAQLETMGWGATIVLAILVSVLSSYYIVLIILASEKKKILVSKFLGHSIWERYSNEIYYFIAIYLFGFGEIFILSQDVVSLFIYSGVVIVDSFIIFLMVRRHEKKSLTLMLKGEE